VDPRGHSAADLIVLIVLGQHRQRRRQAALQRVHQIDLVLGMPFGPEDPIFMAVLKK
jgi:hypothetical protein